MEKPGRFLNGRWHKTRIWGGAKTGRVQRPSGIGRYLVKMVISEITSKVNRMRQNVLHRVLWMFLLIMGTASCGFTPVYAPGSKTSAALSDIVVAPPKNDLANYVFVTELESRIGRNLNGGKVLEHDVLVYEKDDGLVSTATRIQLIGKVNYKVVSIEDKRFLFGGSVENFVSFSSDGLLTTSERRDATKRLMSILADQMTTELMVRISNPVNE